MGGKGRTRKGRAGGREEEGKEGEEKGGMKCPPPTFWVKFTLLKRNSNSSTS